MVIREACEEVVVHLDFKGETPFLQAVEDKGRTWMVSVSHHPTSLGGILTASTMFRSTQCLWQGLRTNQSNKCAVNFKEVIELILKTV